jgi:hypothetical protein
MEFEAAGGASTERHEAKIRAWKRKRWPKIKNLKAGGGRSSSSSKAG